MKKKMKTVSELIAEVKELDEKATPGPWEEFENEVLSPGRYTVTETRFQYSLLVEQHNARLIAQYRTAAPLLAKLLEKAIEQRDFYFRYYEDFLAPDRVNIANDNEELDALVRTAFVAERNGE